MVMHDINIRPWTPQDQPGTMVVLQDGSFSNIEPAFRVALRRKPFQFFTVTVCVVAYSFTKSIIIFIGLMLVMFALLYFAQILGALYYLYGPPLRDMRDVKTNYFSDNDCRFWVAEAKDHRGRKRIVGTIAVMKKAADKNLRKRAWLRRMAVHRDFRGNGIAKKLVAVALQFCKERKYDRVELITTEIQSAAKHLYMALGFQLVGYKPYKYVCGLVRIYTYEFAYSIYH